MINVSRTNEIIEGFDAVWRADFDRALALLHNVDAPGSATMRSRMYLRIGLAKRVISEFERSTTLRLHPRERAEMAVIASSAYRANGDGARSSELWELSEKYARELRDPLFDLLRRCVEAIRAFRDGELERSKEAAERALPIANDLRDTEAQFTYLFDGNHLRARILETLSMHAALEGDIEKRERLLVDAILTSALVRRRDVFAEANILASLAMLLTAHPSARARDLVVSRAKGVLWTEHLDYVRTIIRRGLRCSRDLYGSSDEVDQIAGRGYPTLALRVCDSVDRLLYSHWADRSAFDTELAFVIELVRRIDWSATAGEEFASLASLAAIVAARSPETATEILAIYRAKAQTLSGLFLYAWDGRGPAAEDFAEAAIAKARGQRQLAVERFANARAAWASRDMCAHTALSGIERYTLSRDVTDLEAAAEFLRTVPNSAFSRRLGRAFERTPDALPGVFIYLDQGAGP